MVKQRQSFCIILMGPPGSGKGTQSQQLTQKLHLMHISSGDLLRQAIANQTPLGQKSKAYIDQGTFVPDMLVWELVYEKLLATQDHPAGRILDGFPRTIEQAEQLNQFLTSTDCYYITIVLNVSDEEVIRRIHSRYICPSCKHVYNKQQGLLACPTCNETLIQRADDNLTVLQTRLSEYKKVTDPVIRYYDQLGKVLNISAENSQETVFQQILDFLSTKHLI